MADSSATLHESADKLGPEVIDQHRAIVSLMEELEAIDWYDQRVKASDDPTLAAVLAHNRDEEKEHAVMTLEWLRRHDPVLDRHLRTYLFTEEPITEIEVEAEAEMGGMGAGGSGGAGRAAGSGDGSLGLGNLGRSG
jgi:ferritin-like protein